METSGAETDAEPVWAGEQKPSWGQSGPGFLQSWGHRHVSPVFPLTGCVTLAELLYLSVLVGIRLASLDHLLGIIEVYFSFTLASHCQCP